MAQIQRQLPSRLIHLLLVLPVLLASCQAQIDDQGKRQLRGAAKLIQEKSYATAADELKEFVKTYSASDEIGEAYYLMGLCRVYTNQLDGAGNDFASALAAADVPILEHYVRISLANLAFERQGYSTASEFYGTYLDKLPRRAPFDLAYYRYGLALQATGQWKQADVQFSRVLYLFGGSDIRPSTQEHFNKTHYAIELGSFESLELADRQRQELPDLVTQLPQVRYRRDGWRYVNLYGKFTDLVQAKKAMENIKKQIAQARIVPSR